MTLLFKKKKNACALLTEESGYTLLELLVVMAILGLLLSIAAPMVMKQFGTAKTKTATIQVRALASNLEFFMLDVGRYPTKEEGLESLLTKPSNVVGWNGPYLMQSNSLLDPWGKIYFYEPREGEVPAYKISSLGADGKVGGDGEDRDISNLE